ncbi:hypothetical protein F503_04843 [Ophiostoma piceae UAMH 11346]|uniref:ER transporter 6TM N-terminal domain-containing protein n=1 Tax=Ophiostoma piceae (strain UAMH 11346) TaxID=1262450 RepID=S3CTG7_OPHP1|nr:hypothetical protein F503_04843 [Ophiostoma piceae UAMH 11346]
MADVPPARDDREDAPSLPEDATLQEKDDDERDDVVYEPLASGAKSDPTPSRMRRVPTSATGATATTAPDDMGPTGTGACTDDDDDDDEPEPPKPTFLQRIGLDVPTLMMMFKGSLPPIISLAIYQSDAVAAEYTSLGYLIPIISVITITIMPRGKFLQTLFLNVLSLSVGAALGLLILYSGVQARLNTSGPLTAEELATYKATSRPPYNSSQSAVLAIWLTFSIWLINMLRAKLPSFNLPSIVFSILINVACTTGPLLITMAQAESIIRRIYVAMLTAMAISAGVSLFIIPVSSRKILMVQSNGAIGLMRKAVKLQRAYLRGLERDDMYALATVETAIGDLGPAQEEERKKEELRRKWHKNKKGRKSDEQAPPPLTKEEKSAQALRNTITALRELSGKMQQEVHFAKRDAAFGKLTAHDLGEIVKLLRNIFIPITGMSTIMDIFRRTAESRGWNSAGDPEDKEFLAKERERRVWNEIMKQLHEPFALLSEAIDQGLEHSALQLGLLPKSKEQQAKDKEARKARKAAKAAGKTPESAAAPPSANESNRTSDQGNGEAKDGDTTPGSDDIEASAGLSQPGDHDFVEVVNTKVQQFYNTRSEILRLWARERGLMGDNLSTPTNANGDIDPLFMAREHRQSQLYVLLYMEQLMIATGEAVQDFVQFADKKVVDGTMDKTRFLFPTIRRLRKWLIGMFNDTSPSNEDAEDAMKSNFSIISVGDGFSTKKDPEHLPAVNAWQKFGNGLRAVSRFLGSDESVFGVRAACATMTVAIVCYLKPTQAFFQEQRLVWAMIIIAIGMTQTSGQSIFGFFCRIGGSFIAMVVSYIAWYIVNQKTPGIIVFLWFFIFVEYYFFIKYPRFIAASIITIITQVLIIAYELQVRKIGIKAASTAGQVYYPTYELAPYRLATVAGGSLVAFIWTIFPRPTTDRAWLRRDLSATLYLLANYFSVINETLKTTLHSTGGSPDVPGTPAHKLLKMRQKLFAKLMLLLPSLQMHSAWQRWEPTIGGAFPRAAYDDIILRSGRILNYLTLISYTVTWRPRHAPDKVDADWIEALSELVRSIGPTHYTILSTLTLLSNSLLSGQSLPPYIPLPRPYELTRQLLALKKDIGAASGGATTPATGGDATSGAAAPSAVGSKPRRRNSVWGKQSWRPEAGSHDVNAGGGLYMRQLEDDFGATPAALAPTTSVPDHNRKPTWRDVSENEVSTSTGSPLQRIGTSTAANLGSVLDAHNMEQRGYTEFAVLQVCSTLICDDLEGMIQTISGLVGVVDFSFRLDVSQVNVADDDEKGKGKKD